MPKAPTDRVEQTPAPRPSAGRARTRVKPVVFVTVAGTQFRKPDLDVHFAETPVVASDCAHACASHGVGVVCSCNKVCTCNPQSCGCVGHTCSCDGQGGGGGGWCSCNQVCTCVPVH